MSFKDQLRKIKDNWLLILLVLVLIILFSGSTVSNIVSSVAPSFSTAKVASGSSLEALRAGTAPLPTVVMNQNFAPDVTQRTIIKTASLTDEVPHGMFSTAQSQVMDIVKMSGSFLLNQNVNVFETGISSYYQGTYQIKVSTDKYDTVLSQLKAIGKVTYFNENAEDVTGSVQDLQNQLAAEQTRLKAYQDMLSSAQSTQDKIDLTDRIFNEQQTIKSIEDALNNINQRVDYSTIYFTLNEKQSQFADITFAKFGDLVRNLVDSLNSLLTLIFVLLPWAVVAWIIWFIVKRKKK